MTSIHTIKQQYRRQASKRRKQLSSQQRSLYSQQIITSLIQYLNSISKDHEAIQILAYRSLPFEVDTSRLFQHHHFQTYAPRMLEGNHLEWVKTDQYTTWKKAAFGVLEPECGDIWQPTRQATMLVCPLLAFDRQGNRLGMGKGYFDRWLEHYASALEAQIGLAFSCQMLPKVPVEPHDAPLSMVITESEVMNV